MAVKASSFVFLVLLAAGGCRQPDTYNSFADYPGFAEYYADSCSAREDDKPPPGGDVELLAQYQPRFFLPPGSAPPVDFYRDYLPCTTMRLYPDGVLIGGEVTRELLLSRRRDRRAYLDLDEECVSGKRGGLPALYGRVYRERVSFPDGGGGEETFTLTFLKYNIVSAVSGLAAELPRLHRLLLLFPGLDAESWHELDNFAAVHIVLDEKLEPLAVVIAQHNHHRTYLISRDVALPADGRLAFDVAKRSNEIYLSSDAAFSQRHRVVQWSLQLEYLLSGREKPFFSAWDVTWGPRAGGREGTFDLKVLSPCDPLYISEMLLGEPRPFFGKYIGRDGPPGSDYYNVPALLPLGRMLKFGYLHDGDPSDIALVEEAVDRKGKKIDITKILAYGGRRFLVDWQSLPPEGKTR